jgi:hypothetical protein
MMALFTKSDPINGRGVAGGRTDGPVDTHHFDNPIEDRSSHTFWGEP